MEAVERQRFVQEMRLEVSGGLVSHGKRKNGHPAAVLSLGMPSAQDAPQNRHQSQSYLYVLFFGLSVSLYLSCSRVCWWRIQLACATMNPGAKKIKSDTYGSYKGPIVRGYRGGKLEMSRKDK